MRIDRWYPHRPEGARGGSAARLAGYRRQFRAGSLGGTVHPAPAVPNVDRLVDEAMKAALAGEVRDDITFGQFASMFGFCRSAVMQEGRLLEQSIEQAIQRHPELKLLPTKPMPIVPAAQEMLKRTPSDEIKGIRFPSRVHSTETYRPDLFVINRAKHSGLILDIKRSLGSYRPQEIDRLRFRMLAVAAIAPEWVAENQGSLLVEIETAIVDGSDEMSDHEHGVFRLSEIDDLLEVDGVAAFVRQVREGFSRRVQEELGRRCRMLSGGQSTEGGSEPSEPSPLGALGEPEGARPTVVPLQASARGERRFGYARRQSLH